MGHNPHMAREGQWHHTCNTCVPTMPCTMPCVCVCVCVCLSFIDMMTDIIQFATISLPTKRLGRRPISLCSMLPCFLLPCYLSIGALSRSLPYTLESYLKPPNTAPRHAFGAPVELNGDTLAVGGRSDCALRIDAFQYEPTRPCNGTVYVYFKERPSGAWGLQAVLSAPNGAPGGAFGTALSLDADTLLVGAQYDRSCSTAVANLAANDVDCPGAGAAFVFVRANGVWSLQAYLKPPKSISGLGFGAAVAVSGEIAVVTAPSEASCSTKSDQKIEADTNCTNAGAAYAFQRTGSKWAFHVRTRTQATPAWGQLALTQAACARARTLYCRPSHHCRHQPGYCCHWCVGRRLLLNLHLGPTRG